VVATWLGRNQWFNADDWGFIAERGLLSGDRSWLEPHNEHWSTTPILVYKLLYLAFELRTHIPYVVAAVLVHLCVMHLAYRLAKRAGADPWPAAAVTAAFGLCATNTEMLFFPFTLNLSGAIAFGFLHLLMVDHDVGFGRRDAAAFAVGVAALTCSGIAVPLLAASSLAVLLRRGWRAALVTSVPLAVVYVAWYAVWGHRGVTTETTFGPLDIASFVTDGVRATARLWSGYSLLGDAALLALLGWLTLRWRQRATDRPRVALQVALVTGVVAMFATTAVGRASFSSPLAPRYTYMATAMLVAPAAAMLTSMLAPIRRLRRGQPLAALASVLVVSLPIAYGVTRLEAASERMAKDEQNLRRFVVASAVLYRGDPPAARDTLRIAVNSRVNIEFLRTLSASNALGSQTPTERDKELARALHRVVVSEQEVGEPATRSELLRAIDGRVTRDDATGCLDARNPRSPNSRFTLESPGMTAFSVTTAAELRVALVDSEGNTSPGITQPTSKGGQRETRRWWVSLEWRGRVDVRILGGSATVCGIE